MPRRFDTLEIEQSDVTKRFMLKMLNHNGLDEESILPTANTHSAQQTFNRHDTNAPGNVELLARPTAIEMNRNRSKQRDRARKHTYLIVQCR